MHRILTTAAMLGALALPALAEGDRPESAKQWGQWRGPLGTGVAPNGDPPLTWSEDRNVRWKVAIPGKGQSTPVVWGNRVFVTSAVPSGPTEGSRGEHIHGAHDNVEALRKQKFVVLALDRGDGSVLWQRTVREARPHETAHSSGTWASSSAATDGEHVIASFGSAGLYGLDMRGEPVWQADLGDMRIKHGHGEGSSPALQGNTVVVNWDHQGESFVIALDKRTGKQRWKVSRDEATSWSSPLIVEHDGKQQVVISATRRVRGYDLDSGEVIWECGGLSGNVVASPVAAGGFVYAANSYETRAMLAIRLSAARGDITGTDAVVWTRDRDTPYVPSPVLYGDALCFMKHYQSVLTCVAGKTGSALTGPRRLPGIGDVYASPVGAAGRIYVVSRNGATAVLKSGGDFELMATNRLDESFSASPAIAGDELFLRGERNLYCIAEEAGD